MCRLSAILLCCLLVAACKKKEQAVPDTFDQRWESLPSYLQDVNAYYIAYIDADGTVRELSKGITAQGKKVSNKTLFEAASLSKTYFAYLYWHLLQQGKINRDSIDFERCGSSDSLKVSPFSLLAHTYPSADSCVQALVSPAVFSYSENGYLLLQSGLERLRGKGLEEMAREEIFTPLALQSASFLWQDTNSNYVHGYVGNSDFERNIHIFREAKANGTLYTNGEDLVNFVRTLSRSSEFDSMSVSPLVQVPNFDRLRWGRGMGMEINNSQTYMWQWGSNYTYNNLVLVNKADKSAFVCLTNSITAAQRIRQVCNRLFETNFQLFDYLGW